VCADVSKVTRCVNIAAVKVAELTQLIHTALDSDVAARACGQVGMATSSTSDVTVATAETVDMAAARQTATMLLSASASDDDDDSSSSSSVVHLASVPAAATVIDSGTSLCCLFHLAVSLMQAKSMDTVQATPLTATLASSR